MKQYKKKPVVIEAIKFLDDPNRILEIKDFMGVNTMTVSYQDPANPFIRIDTLEGEMKAMVGDYIIKGVNGEFYPCKPDIFEKTYDEVNNTHASMNLGEAIKVLKEGGVVRRKGWNGKDIVVFKQVPAHIGNTIVPNMQSLPEKAKSIILEKVGHIDYTSQCLIYNTKTGRADSWVPSISDVFFRRLGNRWIINWVKHPAARGLYVPPLKKNNYENSRFIIWWT